MSTVERFQCIISLTVNECKCTSEYGERTSDGVLIEDYCDRWNYTVDYEWCYLTNDMNAASCPGAQKSERGDFYWTKDEAICRGKETTFRVSKHFSSRHIMRVQKYTVLVVYLTQAHT